MVVGRFSIVALTLVAGMFSGPGSNANAAVVLITGADSETGLLLATEYADRGWRVIATCADPEIASRLQSLADVYEGFSIEALNVLDHQQVDDLAEKLQKTQVDVLINNAELSPMMKSHELGNLEFSKFDDYMAMNVIATLKITESFVEHVAASDQKKIITITSADSSIMNVREAQDYFYRASKAAVNIVMVTMAPDLSQRGIVVGLIAPDSTGGGAGDTNTRNIVETIAMFTPETSGSFRRFDGLELAW